MRKLGVLLVSVLRIRAVLFGVYIRTPDFLETPVWKELLVARTVKLFRCHGDTWGNVLHHPRGSRYLIIKKLGLKDHLYHGLWMVSGPAF